MSPTSTVPLPASGQAPETRPPVGFSDAVFSRGTLKQEHGIELVFCDAFSDLREAGLHVQTPCTSTGLGKTGLGPCSSLSPVPSFARRPDFLYVTEQSRAQQLPACDVFPRDWRETCSRPQHESAGLVHFSCLSCSEFADPPSPLDLRRRPACSGALRRLLIQRL